MRQRKFPAATIPICLTMAFVIFLLSPPANPSACACTKDRFIVEINIGHDKGRPGATSACGIPEYQFNQAIAQAIAKELSRHDFRVRLSTGITQGMPRRGKQKQAPQPSLLISVHHDSVQPQYLSTWTCNGATHQYTDEFSGFSIFYSEKYGRPKDNFLYATLLGTQLLRQGLKPTLHHAEKIKGENRTLVDPARGIYVFDDLLILKRARFPAILLECGIIVNRTDEQTIATEAYRKRIATAIADSVESYCDSHP